MKIFLSHSSRNKPLVREIKSHFPEHIKLWIDEKDLLIGDNIEHSIKDAIETNSDYIIFFIDGSTITSSWVLKELSWALSHEAEIGRTFILPVLLERDAISSEALKILSQRKYLSCLDFSENSIRNLASSIISELFAWLSRDINKAPKNEIKETTIQLLDEADQYTAQVADQIRLIVYPYRRDTSLEIEELYKIVQNKKEFNKLNFPQFLKLLERLQQQGYLSGIVCNGLNIFVEEEHFAWKTAVFTNAKKRIAKKAVSLIESGNIIAMDAGSTTLEVSKQIGNGLRMKAWKNLKIITNSLSAANELLSVSSEMGWDDVSSLVEVYIIGGRIRPNTLAVVNDNLEFKQKYNDDFKNMLTSFGNADIAFVGCNGIHSDFGFSTHNNVEVYTKCDILSYSKKRIILTDPSKFGIKEERVFATFDDSLDVITISDGFEETISNYEKFFETTSTNLILA